MNPWFITGFIDGVGSFNISISKNNKYKDGWRIKLTFSIAWHSKDRVLLECIQNYFKVGGVKSQDYEDFKQVVLMVKDKKHLTPEGLNLIKNIKEGMNKLRKE